MNKIVIKNTPTKDYTPLSIDGGNGMTCLEISEDTLRVPNLEVMGNANIQLKPIRTEFRHIIGGGYYANSSSKRYFPLVGGYLESVQSGRGITDYRVVCDETNNTGDVIDANEFVGDIFIKPTRSINFIRLNFVAVRTAVSFAEVGV